MAGIVTTSLVVQFGAGSDSYHLSAEIDSRTDGFNGGSTSFIGGDSPAFLVYKDTELSLAFIASTGGVQQIGSGTIQQEEWLVFANEKTKSLAKPPTGTVTLTRYGGTSGATVVGSNVTLPSQGVAVYKAVYNANYTAYKLTNIPTTINGESTFQVIVVITGTAA